MPVVPVGEWRPDISDFMSSTSANVLNVVPRADGYGPFASLAEISTALGAQCRGAFCAYATDGSITVFAGTSTDLYKLNNATFAWSKVSKSGGPYAALSAEDNWSFCQFNSLVIACNSNENVQVWTLGSSSAFRDLAGSPPKARYCDTVGRFVVLSGLLTYPNRVWWSGLNDVDGASSWTQGVNFCDYQDLPDGGFTRGICGGESGIIFQDTVIRRMSYLPGDARVFQIERIAEQHGIYGPQSRVKAGSSVYFFSLKGFHRIDPGGVPVPIGREKVDRAVLADIDTNNLQLFQGCADPRSSRVFWAYKSVNGSSNLFDKLICYDPVLDRFTPIQLSGEILLQVSRPGLTLENMDALAPGAISVTGAANNGSGKVRLTVTSTAGWSTGDYKSIQSVTGTTEANGNWFITVIDSTHIDLQGSTYANAYVSGGQVGGSLDAMTATLDSYSTKIIPELAAFDSAHALSFFRGSNLEATLESAEQGADGKRIKIRKGFRPISDAATVYGSASSRENLQSTVTAGSESLVNSVTGYCNMLIDTRYSRYKVRIPAGTSWNYFNGFEPDVIATGMR